MNKRLFKSFSLVSLMTLFSRVLGFARDIAFAHIFGASGAFDAFLVAFKIPNFMRRLFAEGAFSQAFVPVLAHYRENNNEEEVKTFINRMATALGLALLLLVLLAEFLTPAFVTIFAPGFAYQNPQQFELATQFLHITFPYILLIALTALSGSIMNCWNRFGVPAFTPVLLNLTLIFAAIGVAQYFNVPERALALGVLVAGILQLLFQVPFLYHWNLLPRLQWFWKDKGVRRVLKLMLPALFGVSVAQISLLLDTTFASFLPNGSIAWLYYSERLTYFPLGVFGVALSTVIMPHLSRSHAGQSYEYFSKTLNSALRVNLLISLPASLGLFIMAGPLLATLFQSGQFGSYDVWMAQKSLKTLAIGLPAFMSVKILVTGFYSRQNFKTPVKIAVVSLIMNILLNFALIVPMAHAGLALATSVSAWLNAGLLLFVLKKEAMVQLDRQWGWFLLKLILANGLMLVTLIVGLPNLSAWLTGGHWYKMGSLLLWIVIAITVYCLALWVMRVNLKTLKAL